MAKTSKIVGELEFEKAGALFLFMGANGVAKTSSVSMATTFVMSSRGVWLH